MFFKKVGTLVLAGTLLLNLSGCAKGPEGVAASVNKVDVQMEDFYKSYAVRRNQYISQSGGDEKVLENLVDPTGKQSKLTIDQYLKQVAIKDLTETEALKQDALANDIKVEDKEIDEIIDNYKAQLGGEEGLKAYLDSMGIPLDYLKEVIYNQTLIGKYTQDKFNKVKVTDDEVKKYYDDNKDTFFKAKASHILVKDLKKANLLRKDIKKGKDFAEVAKLESEDTGSARNGGELGEFTNGQMVESFDKAIRDLKEGEISEPIQSNYGFHIIKLEKKSARTFDEVKEELKNKLTQEKYQKEIKDVIDKAKIKTYVDPKKDLELPDEYKNYGKVKTDTANTEEAANESANKEANASAKNGEAEKTESAEKNEK